MERELNYNEIRNLVYAYFYKERNDVDEFLKYLGKPILFNLFNLERYGEECFEREKEKYGENCETLFLRSLPLYNIFEKGTSKIHDLEKMFKDEYQIRHGFDNPINIYFENNIIRYQYFKNAKETFDKFEIILDLVYNFLRSTCLEATKENIDFYLKEVIVKIIEKINFLYEEAKKINEETIKEFNEIWNSESLDEKTKKEFILYSDYIA